jgi:hypothetical protein
VGKRSSFSGYYDGQVLPSLVGIVVYKSLLAEQPYGQEVVTNPLRNTGRDNDQDLQGRNAYQMFCQGQSNDYQRNERYMVKPKVIHRECNLILRDETCPDIVSVYIPAHMAIAAVVGFKVILTNATVFITKTKKVCLKYSRIHKTKIGILGMTSGVQLESLCLRSTTLPRASQPDVHKDYIAPAPRVTVFHLVLSQNGNLALWSILGQMIHIKKINVNLKCILCHSNVKEGNTGFACWSCSNRDCTQPIWTATVVFDDGTGECLVHIEGDPVLTMLKSKVITTADSKKLKELQSTVETFCKQYGEVRYDSYYSRWNKIDALNSAHDDDEVMMMMMFT